MNHLIVIDPIERLSLELDSSLRLARAFEKNGDTVRFVQAENLVAKMEHKGSLTPGGRTFYLDLANLSSDTRPVDYKFEPLSQFTTVHMRKEPPFNLSYITACWILNMVSPSQTHVFNKPDALLAINEKLSIFHFPDFADEALVCQTAEEAAAYIETTDDVIVKPLDMYGGRGVRRIKREGRGKAALAEALDEDFKLGPRILQPFNAEIYKGEIRVFGFGEKILSWCLKKPKGDSIFANTREGATLHPFTPSNELKSKVERMGKQLVDLGVTIWGIDVIGDKLSEINVTSPRLLTVDGDEEKKYGELARLICEHVAAS